MWHKWLASGGSLGHFLKILRSKKGEIP